MKVKDFYNTIYNNILKNQEEDDYYKWEVKETREPTKWEILIMIEKFIEKHPRNIIKILESLPEEEIQKFLRAKKLKKIKNGK